MEKWSGVSNLYWLFMIYLLMSPKTCHSILLDFLADTNKGTFFHMGPDLFKTESENPVEQI